MKYWREIGNLVAWCHNNNQPRNISKMKVLAIGSKKCLMEGSKTGKDVCSIFSQNNSSSVTYIELHDAGNECINRNMVPGTMIEEKL